MTLPYYDIVLRPLRFDSEVKAIGTPADSTFPACSAVTDDMVAGSPGGHAR
jgi:hypothetical protein